MVIALLVCLQVAFASQTGEVLRDETPVFQYPNPTSPRLGTLAKGQRVPLSNQMVQGARGFYWYKVRLPNGEMGYSVADSIRADAQIEDLRSSGLDLAGVPGKELDDQGWAFSVRAMGLGGWRTLAKTTTFGGEAEASVSPFLNDRGYARRRFAVGAFYATGRELSLVGGSLIYRVFSEGSLVEPELRLRVGKETVKDYLGLGFAAGMRHPLTLSPSPQIAFSWEAGFLFSITRGKRDILASASAGIGFYF